MRRDKGAVNGQAPSDSQLRNSDLKVVSVVCLCC